jgi:hypothetical protein
VVWPKEKLFEVLDFLDKNLDLGGNDLYHLFEKKTYNTSVPFAKQLS